MQRGRPGKQTTVRVDYTKVSKYTWAFRLRRRGEDGVESVKVLKRVTDAEFKQIKATRAGLSTYKRQLLEEYA
jgi:hypothetical protein